ncbi:hypothetical protein EMIT0P258_50016 [Pseudomonas sp. IT-P258]
MAPMPLAKGIYKASFSASHGHEDWWSNTMGNLVRPKANGRARLYNNPFEIYQPQHAQTNGRECLDMSAAGIQTPDLATSPAKQIIQFRSAK